MAGIDKEVGYRLLRDRYLELRRSGVTAADTLQAIGFSSSRVPAWEAAVELDHGRHHLRVDASREAAFWVAFDAGTDLASSAVVARVSGSTGYRWVHRRFHELRSEGLSVARAARKLRLAVGRAAVLERERQQRVIRDSLVLAAARRDSAALVDVGLHETDAVRKRRERADSYWQLMREGVSNVDACRLLGMSRRSGTLIRKQNNFLIPPLVPPRSTGRYLTMRERMQIADLLRMGCTIRQIGVQLGRHASTISRELHRHRDGAGNYLPRTADHDAHRQRARPKVSRLAANTSLRRLVQRKLNRCWSPEEISGWLRKTYPEDDGMRVCHETIYRALPLREDTGLHKRYALKLRTGRRIRKTRWRTRSGQGSRIRNMVMIDQRPAEIETKEIAGHWEGDLIVGVGSVSAMVTLRERTTQYGMVINLPHDHTAASVNTAVIGAFATLPAHLKRSLTWDQGVEMASHEALTKATGIPIYFAERASPWQRGANENYNGLLRQYFPKGTDLAQHTASHVAHVMNEINTRPRKGLGYDTPAQRLSAAHRTSKRP
ncbi:IS30 family transposase [Orlajensenia flava]|nr:IS30 family transposase [Glaciibacter flavus]